MTRHAFTFPPRKILVPLDLSPASEPAWRSAKALAASFGSKVEGLFVRGGVYLPEVGPVAPDPVETLAALRDRLGASPGEIGVIDGVVEPTLLNWCRSLDFDLIVMGTHARTGPSRAIEGSVAEAVARLSPVPVLVTRRALGKVARVLAPINFEPYALAGLQRAAEIAQAFAAKLTVLHVVDAPLYGAPGTFKAARHMLADAVNRLPADARAACKPKTEIVVGKAAEQIALAAKDADLVALVAHRRPFLTELLLGTTSERVLRHCETPVLSLPTGAPEARGRALAARKARAGGR